MSIKDKIYSTLIPVSHYFKEIIWKYKWFKAPSNKSSFKGIISCVDGRVWHGGMCDRFKGIISSFAYCKQNNIDFRIKYTYPFELSEYLIPNKYDWILKDNEFSENIKESDILYLIAEKYSNRFKIPKRKQIHVYANRDYIKDEDPHKWGDLFNELFKPSLKLQDAITRLHFDDYIAVVFRFQNLIGDFEEYSFSALPEEERNKLLSKCKQSVIDFRNSYPFYKVLVTSDSKTFLDIVKDLDGCYTIPGELVHIDAKGSKDKNDAYLKSFVDFYMISKAKKVFCVGTDIMYPSEFPMYAAKINNVEFQRVRI
ncbi:MAG: hypothetical protein HDT28_07730 [Clostridiales bacterium]|nr:hypothetical protein [Clostridiales bacterium]